MRKMRLQRFWCLLLSFSLLLSVLAGCGSEDAASTTAPAAKEQIDYTVQVKNPGGVALPSVGIYVYEDATKAELVWYAQTDASGKITFTAPAGDGYILVLEGVPTGYDYAQQYPITGALTEIVLEAGKLSEEDMDKVVYALGDMMMDFTVEDAEKDTYTLSKLLEQKKALVLNFWYVECDPCKAEFPFLQEAYEQYKEEIALLAMNPVNTQEQVAKFKADMELTFPMMACDPKWQQMMNITSYPTTVVIDRFGNIVLIHKGGVDSAKTFADAFAYFTADDYTQKLIKDIHELEQESPEGTKENPISIGGVTEFEVTVEPGKTVYVDIYKVKNTYLQIADKDAGVIYEEKTYTAQGGSVGLVVNAPDNYTPARLAFTNSGSAKKTFRVTLTPLKGTINNPYAMSLGEFDAKVSAGNDQGVYYSYVVKEDGELTLKCLNATAGVKYSYVLYNLDSYVQRTLDEEGTKGDDGVPVLTIQGKKGQTIQVIISTLPDDSNSYPAASFRFLAEFAAGEVEETEDVEKIAYTVTVKDGEGNPIPNVSMVLTKVTAEGEEPSEPVTVATNAEGIMTTELPKGSYSGSFTVPEGYDPVEDTTFSLTEEKPEHSITLKKTVIVFCDYVVTVLDAAGAPIAGVKLMLGDTVATTDAEGKVSFHLEEGSYTVQLHTLPEDYTAQQETYAFAEGSVQLQIRLDSKPGTAGNPWEISTYPADIAAIAAGKEQHFLLSGAADRVLQIRNDGAYVRYNGTTYTPVDGLVSVMLGNEAQAALVIGNSADDSRAFTLRLGYPQGAAENPIVLTQLGQFRVSLKQNRTNGCFYTWTATEEGSVHFRTADTRVEILATANGVTAKLSESPDGWASLDVKPGDTVTVQILGKNGALDAELTAEGQFRLPPNSAEHPDVLVDISRFEVMLEDGDTDGHFFVWTPENGGVASFKLEDGAGDIILTMEGSETVVKLSDGMTDANGDPVAAITVARGKQVAIQVTSTVQPAQLTVTGSLTQDPNSAENPTVLSAVTQIRTDLVAGDTNGHYYIYAVPYSGTLAMRIADTTAGTRGALTAWINGGTPVNAVDNQLQLEVKAGDSLLLCVSAVPVAGEYPASRILVESSFAHKLGSSFNPQVITDISSLTAYPEAGDAQGYHLQWTATETGNLTFYIAQAQLNGTAVTGDLAEKIDIALTVNGEAKGKLSDNETKDSEGNRILSLAVQKDDVIGIRVFTRDAAHPEAVVTVKNRREAAYSVTVTDMLGKAQTGVAVIIRDGAGKAVYSASTDTNGRVAFRANAGSYTVELAFEGKTYYYDKAAAVLTQERAALTIRLAEYMDTSATYEDLWALNGAVTYVLPTGSTYVEIGDGKPYYSAEEGGNCLFIFHPEVGGTYKFTVSDPRVEISYRNSPFFVFEVATSRDSEDNAFTYSVGNSTAGFIDMVIGLKVTEGVDGVVVNITRIGEPNFSWEEVENNEDWKQGFTHKTPCATPGGALTYLDINANSGTYDLYYNAETGFYQLSEDGPVIYVDLNSSRYNISLYKIIHGDGFAGGAPIRKYFYDENGTFVKREDYTATLEEYFDCVGLDLPTETGYHPLTKDLKYILQNGGEGWWNSSSPNQIEDLVAANPEYVWMFLCGYR